MGKGSDWLLTGYSSTARGNNARRIGAVKGFHREDGQV